MTGRPTRVLLVDSGVGFAGGQAGLLEIVKNLDASRFAAVVASPAASVVAGRCRAAGWPWRALPFASAGLARGGSAPGRRAGMPGDLADALCGVFWVASLVRRLGIDIVHANTFKAALVCGFACLASGRPMIFHDRTELKHGVLGNLVDSLAARVIVISRAVAAKRGSRAASKVRLVYDGVDGGALQARSAALEMTVGYLGRISSEKGLDLLVEAAPAILAERPGARFVIGGAPLTSDDAAYHEKVKQRVGRLGLEGSFRFAGEVGEARSFLEGVSMLVMPSRREGLGIVALEAMALERPVVGFRTGGIGEAVTDGETGLLVAPGDTGGLARAIAGLLGDAQTARRMGAQGRRRVLDHFTGKAVGEKVMGVYSEIAEGRLR